MLAILLAVAGAFSKPMFTQMGWYDSNGAAAGGGLLGYITTPSGDTPVCTAVGLSTCTIHIFATTYNTYDTKANAEAGGGKGSDGLLKYN